jgi:hypothetical protein
MYKNVYLIMNFQNKNKTIGFTKKKEYVQSSVVYNGKNREVPWCRRRFFFWSGPCGSGPDCVVVLASPGLVDPGTSFRSFVEKIVLIH